MRTSAPSCAAHKLTPMSPGMRCSRAASLVTGSTRASVNSNSSLGKDAADITLSGTYLKTCSRTVACQKKNLDGGEGGERFQLRLLQCMRDYFATLRISRHHPSKSLNHYYLVRGRSASFRCSQAECRIDGAAGSCSRLIVREVRPARAASLFDFGSLCVRRQPSQPCKVRFPYTRSRADEKRLPAAPH